ncbi:hypothetical protein ACFWY9_19050 [Amycolatopsis sp. NPDC059027]|uniref:hypothetical protein n=1 Tax=unclassified Amycolatopsis TaxID=2618356 RepID=UPI003671F079
MKYTGERVEIGIHASCKVRAIPMYRGGSPALSFVDGSDELFFVTGDSWADLHVAMEHAVSQARQWLIFHRFCMDLLNMLYGAITQK